jgi:hypothetical protein
VKGDRRARSAALRMARRGRWEAAFPPWALAAAGAAISAAYLFERSLAARAIMFLCFLAAALVSGKKVSLVATLAVSAGIVAANLLVPVGKVLAVLGPLKLTQTALIDGVGKALVFEGLVYISKASIVPGLRLPGRFGALVASAFLYYDRIIEYKGSIRPATLIADADALMLQLWDEAPAGTPAGDEGERASAGQGPARLLPTVALAAAAAAAYIPLILGLR